MSTATPVPTSANAESRPPTAGWIVSPAFDLLFLANLPWLLALLPGFVADEGTPHIAFWQLYFLTTPHRWITLFLVALDPDRREGRPGRFLALALLGLLAIAGTMLAFPAALLGFELFDHAAAKKGTALFSQRPGKRIYLASVCGLYSVLLLALRDGQTVLVAALATASSLFHAVEYLALVTHYAWRRRTGGSTGLFRTLAERWLLVLVSYVVLFGLSAAVLGRLG